MTEQPIGNGWHLLAPERTEDRPRLTIDKRYAIRLRPAERSAVGREVWAVRKAPPKRDDE